LIESGKADSTYKTWECITILPVRDPGGVFETEIFGYSSLAEAIVLTVLPKGIRDRFVAVVFHGWRITRGSLSNKVGKSVL